ncbi:FKBP-type peptidyl-prolyl cis-trans isomerase [Micrococcales bacterium 31B]|nr:FKBP-type peptidyl-prolyl cis-trans isomerase [Micrococcales bacterium 31B]
MTSPRWKIAAAALSAAAMLSLTSCSLFESPKANSVSVNRDDVAALDTITATVTGAVPTLHAAWPLTFTGSAAKVVQAGEGAEITDGQVLTYQIATYDPATGEVTEQSFSDSAPQEMTLDTAFVDGPLYDTLLGQRVGVYALAVALDPATQAPTLALFHVTGASDTPAAQPAATPVRVEPSALPSITQDATNPTVAAPTTAAPTTTQYAILREGTGAPLVVGTEVTIKYVGFRWATGEVFDSSYGDARNFYYVLGSGQAGAPCLDKVLPGQARGSLLEVVCSSADSFGDNPGAGYPAGALIYLIEVLPDGA